MKVTVVGAVAILSLASAVANPAEEARMVALANDHPEQGRASVTQDPLLSRAAQIRADDMIARKYFSHTNPDGFGPNFLVRSVGYALPAYYPTAHGANNIESFHFEGSSGSPNALQAWNAWMNSALHRDHLLARHAFYQEQTRVGVGIARGRGGVLYVFISAPPPLAISSGDRQGPRVVMKKKGSRGQSTPIVRIEGKAVDPLGVRYVRYRGGAKAWKSGNLNPPTGKWKGKVRLRGKQRGKSRKRGGGSITVTAADYLGNVASRSRSL